MSSALRALVDELEDALTEVLDEEEERVTAERDFLLAVVDGTTEGVNIEDPSSELTETYLTGYISDYLPIDPEA